MTARELVSTLSEEPEIPFTPTVKKQHRARKHAGLPHKRPRIGNLASLFEKVADKK